MIMNRDKFEWISKIIDTCTNDFHFEAVDRLIILLYEIEKDDSQKTELENLRIKKWNEIHVILK